MKARFLGALVFSIVALGVVHAQQQATAPAQPMVLTAADYAEINQLYARYAYAFDGHGSRPGALLWGDVFTPDGVHVNSTGNEFFKGRDMLNAFAGGKLRMERSPSGAVSLYWLDNTRSNNKSEFNSGHFITNIMLEPTADGVKSKAYLMGGNMNPRGIYFDTIVKTAEGWRFKVKHFINAGTPVPETVPAELQPKPRTSTSSR